MNTLNNYILEKLKINKNTVKFPDYIENELVITGMIYNYADEYFDPIIGVNNIYVFNKNDNDKIYCTNYLNKSKITINGFINSKGLFESKNDPENENDVSVFLPKNKYEEYYNDLIKYKNNSKDFPYEKYFDTKIKEKEKLRVSNGEMIEKFYKMLKNYKYEKNN